MGPWSKIPFILFIGGDPVIEGSVQLAKDLYWGGNFEEFVLKYKAGQLNLDHFRFFIGYSGWSSGQLEEELSEKTWIICEDIDAEAIFTSSPDDLWRVALRNMGGDFQVLANYPIDPRLN